MDCPTLMLVRNFFWPRWHQSQFLHSTCEGQAHFSFGACMHQMLHVSSGVQLDGFMIIKPPKCILFIFHSQEEHIVSLDGFWKPINLYPLQVRQTLHVQNKVVASNPTNTCLWNTYLSFLIWKLSRTVDYSQQTHYRTWSIKSSCEIWAPSNNRIKIYSCFCETSHLSQQDSFPVNLVHKSAPTSEYLHAQITIYNFQFNFLEDLGTKILMKNLLELQHWENPARC